LSGRRVVGPSCCRAVVLSGRRVVESLNRWTPVGDDRSLTHALARCISAQSDGSFVTCELSQRFKELSAEQGESVNELANSTDTEVEDYMIGSLFDGTAGWAFWEELASRFIRSVEEYAATGYNDSSPAAASAEKWAGVFPNLLTNLAVLVLNEIGVIEPGTPMIEGTVPIPKNYTGLALKAPWYQPCSNSTLKGCSGVLGSTCSQWDIIFSMDDSSDEKHLFLAVIAVAWTAIAISCLVYYFAFNSYSDYTSAESWSGMVDKVGGFMGWSSVLQNSVTEAGFTASEELGLLLKKVFGGIDMDLTDGLLGAYLATERRQWRRLRTAMATLENHGYSIQEKRGCCRGLFDGVGIDGYGLAELKSMVESGLTDLGLYNISSASDDAKDSSAMDGTIEQQDGDMLIPNLETTSFGRDGIGVQVVKSRPVVVTQGAPPATPFGGEAIWPGALGQSDPNRDPSTAQRDLSSSTPSPHAPRFLDVAYSFIRLDSNVSTSLSKSSRETGRRKKASKWDGSVAGNNQDNDASLRASASGHIKDGTKAHKLMVPVDLSQIAFDPPIDSRNAARICMDDCLGLVSSATLEDALRYSSFSRAAYGLQDKLWKASATGKCGVDCMDGVLSSKCFPTILGSAIDVQGRFKKRNFDAILGLTGIPAEDFLFVSYTNTTFGLLPFLVMLDRANSKVIISIRGTAGLQDLITDILANPVGMNVMLPQSVLDALPPDTEIYAHEGILSSAKAIIHTLETEGVLSKIDAHASGSGHGPPSPATASPAFVRSFRDSLKAQDRAFSSHVSSLRGDSEVAFNLERAQTAVYDAIVLQNYDVVVTGHSLGAAVASVVSVVLKDKYPSLTCFAFNPPGGLVSPELSELAAPYVTSVVVGYDAISRLGVKNVKDLVDDMVFSLCRCKRPKLKIALDVLLSKRKNPLTCPRTYCSFDNIDDQVREIILEFLEHSAVHNEDIQDRLLVPMGKIVFLRPYLMDRARNDVQWDAVFADPADIVREGILLSSLSFKHHRLPVVIEAIKACIDDAEASATARV